MADQRSEFARRVGVGETSSFGFLTERGKMPRRRRVIVEEGPDRGTVGGYQTDHPDGRLDAHVHAPTTTMSGAASLPE